MLEKRVFYHVGQNDTVLLNTGKISALLSSGRRGLKPANLETY